MFENKSVAALSIILVAFVAMIITSVFVPVIRDYLAGAGIVLTLVSVGVMFLPNSSAQKVPVRASNR